MKSFLKPFVAMGAVAFFASQAMAHDPPAVTPATDIGVYATKDATLNPDPDLAKAYDNFSLTMDQLITGFDWSGVYAEPLPVAPTDTDFLIQIWEPDGANNGFAHVHVGPVLEFLLDGGTAGMSGPDVTVTPLGFTSPHTDTTPGDGEAFGYQASVSPTLLAAGDYWISILALQDFSSPDPIVDPEWQWLIAGAGDGFTAFDRTNMPPGTLQAGILQPDKDLEFTIHMSPVPEPSSMLMGLFGLASLGLLRRKRK